MELLLLRLIPHVHPWGRHVRCVYAIAGGWTWANDRRPPELWTLDLPFSEHRPRGTFHALATSR